MTYNWTENSLDTRAPRGGEIGVDGVYRRGGEFEPFYIPRAEMPQVKNPAAFAGWLADRGVGVKLRDVDPASLERRQRILFLRLQDKGLKASMASPIVVSGDDFIVDGNHRVAAAVMLGRKEISAYVVDEKFATVCALAFEFGARTSKKGT